METAVLKLNSQSTASKNSQSISPIQAEFSKQFAGLPVKKVDDLIHSDAPQLNQVDRGALSLCISLEIGKLLNFIGCTMSEETTYEIAQMMIDNHPHIPVDAIKSFFYEAKRGTYGFHYNKMDGTKLLMWYDKFVNDYYVQLEEMEYQKHVSVKDGRGTPLEITDEDGQSIDYNELLASFRGKTKEELEREKKVAEIRYQVQKKNIHLYDSLPVEEADKRIENAIIEEMKAQGLLTF
jgi:hypothetical protein